MKQMLPNVAHVVISLNCGGLESLVVKWTNFRSEEGGKTYIICLDSTGDFANKVNPDNVFCVSAKRYKFPWDINAVDRIRQFVKDKNITVLHSHNLTAMQYSSLASMCREVHHVYTQHGENIHHGRVVDKIRKKVFLHFVDRIVAVSESVRTFMSSQQWVNGNLISVISNGVDINHEITNSSELTEGVLILGSVGRLAFVKGWDLFLPVYQTILKELPSIQIKLLLVGDGPEREKLEKLVKQLNIRDHVVFEGMKDNVTDYLEKMDVFLLPSRNEGLSVALLEAMAMGKPSIVTDVGENRRVLNNGECGLILSKGKDSWVECIVAYLLNTKLLSKHSRLAARRVKNCYTLQQNIESYEHIYLSIFK